LRCTQATTTGAMMPSAAAWRRGASRETRLDP
jgi:hypothetical protein